MPYAPPKDARRGQARGRRTTGRRVGDMAAVVATSTAGASLTSDRQGSRTARVRAAPY